MTGFTIRRTYRLVVESSLLPIGGVMAARTLPAIVIGRFTLQMAELAIAGVARLVVEGGLRPGTSVGTG